MLIIDSYYYAEKFNSYLHFLKFTLYNQFMVYINAVIQQNFSPFNYIKRR